MGIFLIEHAYLKETSDILTRNIYSSLRVASILQTHQPSLKNVKRGMLFLLQCNIIMKILDVYNMYF